MDESDFFIAPRPSANAAPAWKSKSEKRQEAKKRAENIKMEKKKEKIMKAISKMSIAELHMLKRKKTAEMLGILTSNKFRHKVHEFLPESTTVTSVQTPADTSSHQVVTYNDDGTLDEEDEFEDMTLEEKESVLNERKVQKEKKVLKSELKDLEAAMTKSRKKKLTLKPKKRELRLCPEEVPIKKEPIEETRYVVQKKSGFIRDPRFDDLSSEMTKERSTWWNDFLKEMRTSEKTEVRKAMKREKDPEKREQLRSLMHRFKTQDFSLNQQGERMKIREKYMREQIDRMKQGQRPFYLKKSKEKQLNLMEQYKKLKEMGKLDVYMQRRNRRKTGNAMMH